MTTVGGAIQLFPTWGGSPSVVDLQWDTNNLSMPDPIGTFWGDIGYFAETGSNTGHFKFDRASNDISLRVDVPAGGPGYYRIVAVIRGCGLPLPLHGSGTGEVMYGVSGTMPGTSLIFNWTTP